MEVSITDINDVQKEIEVTASAEELTPHFEKAYKEQLPRIEIKGFRKGKVPLDLVKKLHGESIEQQSLDSIVSDVYRQLVRERNIQTIGDPVLTEMDYKRGEALKFKISYEIKPTFELKDYKGLTVEKLVHRVTETEMEEEILRLRRANSTLSPAAEVTDDEHIVTADIQEIDPTGNPLIGKRTPDVRLYLADETVFEEVKAVLRHAAAGSVLRVTVTPQKGERKEPTHLEITVKKIEKVSLPELDADLVKKMTKGKYETPDEFRKHLREDLERYWQDRSERMLTDALIGEIVRRHDFTVPESLIRTVIDSLLEELKDRYPSKKLPPGFDEKDFREKNRAYGVFQAKWYLVRERIIEAEKLGVDAADLDRLADLEAEKLGMDKNRLKTFYESSEAVKSRIVSDKLLSFLKAHATISERVVEDPV
ncbi:MAG TPA: trigger factor [Bacteroidota bacterium]|nr:trigger factor [Bacteroidota bacterium]